MFVGYTVLPADDKARLSSAHYLHRCLPHFKFSLQILAVGVCVSNAFIARVEYHPKTDRKREAALADFRGSEKTDRHFKTIFSVSQDVISHYQNILEIFLMPKKLLQLICN
jgi:hypothetical protein